MYWLYARFRHFESKTRQSLQISLWRIVVYRVVQTIEDIRRVILIKLEIMQKVAMDL